MPEPGSARSTLPCHGRRRSLAIFLLTGCVTLLSACASPVATIAEDADEAHAACAASDDGVTPQLVWRIENPLPVFDRPEHACEYLGIFARIAADEEAWAGEGRSPSGRRSTPYPTAWNGVANSYDRLPGRDVLTVVLGVANAPAGSTCRWSVAGRRIGASSCTDVRHRIAPDANGRIVSTAVTVEVTSPDAPPMVQVGTIAPRHLTIVSIGDSYASGEGVPDVHPNAKGDLAHPHQFWDTRCHRSLFSGPALAAAALVRDDPHLAVTFLSYACSGATIEEGLRKGYQGRENYLQVERFYARRRIHFERFRRPLVSREPLLPPQLEAASQDLRGRRPDYVLVSVGGNDIGFASIVVDIVKERCALDTAGSKTSCQVLLEERLKDLEHLNGWYHELAKDIDDRLNPANVVITEYPDLTKDNDGRWCDDRRNAGLDGSSIGNSTFFGRGEAMLPGVLNSTLGVGPEVRITEDETSFAYNEALVPLNNEIATAASQLKAYRWTLVGGLESASAKNGYCSKLPHFNNYHRSLRRQGEIAKVGRDGGVSSGAAHPNILGARLYGCLIAWQIKILEAKVTEARPDLLPRVCKHVIADGVDPTIGRI